MVAGILIAGWLLSAGCVFHLWWARTASWWRKLAWSIALLVPFLGPLFYAALFESLPSQPAEMRAREHPDIWGGP